MSTAAMPRTSAAQKTAVLVSSDLSFRQRVRDTLVGLRWQVREACGGAEALAHLDAASAEALILDSWLPDLEINEFIREFEQAYPEVDLITTDGAAESRPQARSPRRNELLYAMRSGQDGDGAIWNTAPVLEEMEPLTRPLLKSSLGCSMPSPQRATGRTAAIDKARRFPSAQMEREKTGAARTDTAQSSPQAAKRASAIRLPELIGEDAVMLEVSRRIRLVAPRTTPVLIQGPTGSGKELVAQAVHRLSPRSEEPLVALNCAAIPEALLEAELFGHTRGAFTGAVQGRVGRIEAAQGGTLFLDEIGEMPVSLQAKLLRFVECGELQRVGDNVTIRADVRIVAATHRPLGELCREGKFRTDLYYRLAVFLVRTPSLASHVSDLPSLAEYFLARLGEQSPKKRLEDAALEKLLAHDWPGNVRELEHVLERACILAEDRVEIEHDDIEFGDTPCFP